MSEFKQKAIAGISWSVVSQVGRQLVAFVVGIILARLLSPREFGLIAMIVVFTGFANVFAELGLGAALIHKQDIEQRHLSSVFWVNIGSGIFLTGLFMLAAPLIGAFYGEPLLVPVTLVMATTFLFGSLGIIQKTLLSKAVDFKTLSIAEIAGVGFSGIVAIALAYRGFGVWSLVARYVLGIAGTTTLLWVLHSWRPDFSFRWSAVKELLGFSTSLLGSRSLNYWVRNLDDLLIGKIIGEGALGVYNRAYKIMLFPLQNVSQVIARVMFPSLSTIQDDKARVKRIYLTMTRTIALVTFPLMLGLLVTAESFVLAVLGPQWSRMIPILQIFCLLGLSQSIGTLVGNLYLSQGRADLQFRVGLVIKPFLIAAIVIGLPWGAVGVAISYATASLLTSYPSFHFAGRLVGLTYANLLRSLAGVFACAAVMAALVFGLGRMLPASWSHWAYLAVQVPFGTGSYFAIAHFSKLTAYQEARRLLTEQWHNRQQLPSTS